MGKKRRKTRSNGEGTIYKRGDRWIGQLTLGYGPDGKRKTKTVRAKTRREVADELAKLQTQKAAGTIVATEKMTVAEWLDHWLQHIARPTVRGTTLESYASTIKCQLKPWIGGVQLQKLTPIHVQRLLTALEDAGASDRIRQLAYTVLRRSLKIALEQGVVSRNACDAVQRPKLQKKEIRPLSADEVATLLAELEGTRWYALIVLAVDTGMRQGEIFGLLWSDVDLEGRRLQVVRNLQEVKGQHIVGEPKSAKGRRRITLTRRAVAALSQHRAVLLREGLASCDKVFPDSKGGWLRKSNFLRKVWHPALEDAGLPSVRFHDLRHTCATSLLQAGVHPKVVQERLGHSQISLTMDTYSHTIESMDAEAANIQDAMLEAAEKARKSGKATG